MQTQGANQLVMLSMMMFGEAITSVGFPRGPTDTEHFLTDAITDPTVSHVHGLGSCFLASFVDNGVSSGVVHLDRAGWLLMVQFCQGDAERAVLFGIVEQGGKFGFHSR